MGPVLPESPLVRHRAPLPDDAFFRAFSTGALALPAWDHLSHLRAARLLVADRSLPEAIEAMSTGIRRLNRANRIPQTDASGYHRTLTVAFMHLVADAWIRDPGITSLDFCIRHADLMDRRIVLDHYSRETLWTPEARARFVPPDRRPLPGHLRLAS